MNKTMTKAELSALIKDNFGEMLIEKFEEAFEPYMKQHSNWMEQLEKASADQRAARAVPEHLKGFGAARCVRAMAAGKGDPERAAKWADKVYDDDLGKAVVKALQVGLMDAGGFLVPPEFLPEVIELLRGRSVIRSASPRVVPMNQGSLTLRKHTVGSNAAYVGESRDIAVTEPKGGHIELTAKKLAAIVPISNDLLIYSDNPSADEWVRDDLVQEMATREDKAFIRDDGTNNTPKGLRFWVDSANVTSQTGGAAATSVQVEADIRIMVNNLETKDVQMIRPAWFMNPRTKNYLANRRDDASGDLIYPEMRNSPMRLYGFPAFDSTHIPINLGGGSDESELYLVDMFHAIIGEVGTLAIAVNDSASYIESAQLVSAFSRDETLMRAISRHDFAVRHDEAIAVLDTVLWGS